MNNEPQQLTPELQEALEKMKAPETSPHFYDNLQARLDEQTSAPKHARHKNNKYFRPRYVLPALTTTAAAVLAIALISSSSFNDNSSKEKIAIPSTSTSSAPNTVANFNPKLASEVIAKAEQSYASIHGVSGTSHTTNTCADSTSNDKCIGKDPTVIDRQFRISSDGSFWISATSNKNDPGNYSASYRAFNDTSQYLGDTYTVGQVGATNQLTNVVGGDPGDATETGYDFSPFGRFSLTSLLNGLSTDKNAALSDTTYDGHEAWSIHAKGLPTDAFGISPDEVIAIFDKTTLLPLSVESRLHDTPYSTTTVKDLIVNPTFSDSDFTITAPKDVKVVNKKSDTQTIDDLDDIAKNTPYKALVPTFVPDGYKLIHIGFTKDVGASGAEGMNSYNKSVVKLTYARGLQRLEFTTREVGPHPKDWIDPFSQEGQQNAAEVAYKIQGGAYNAVNAELITGFGVTPHAWVIGSTTVTTFSGDVSVDELKHMLNSVERA
jgi:hypothetical protein